MDTKRKNMENKNPLKLIGTITWIGETTTGTNNEGKSWQRRSFLIVTEENGYKNTVGFQAWADQVETISRAKIGDQATVYFTPITREHEGKLYTDLKAYGINLKFVKA